MPPPKTPLTSAANRPDRSLSTADLFDEFEERCWSCPVQFIQYGGRRVFSGAIRTVECREDNALLRSVLETPSSGEVLVVDGGGSVSAALLGDVVAKIAARNGWSGVVIRGAVRDVRALAAIDFGVKALGSNPRRSAKRGEGFLGGEIVFGGVRFAPGQWLYSDDDGILVADGPLPIR